MTDRLEDFSRDALERRSVLNYIANYNQTHYSSGYTVVSYNEYIRPEIHLKFALFTLATSLPASLLVDGLDRLVQDKEFRYFQTQEGVYLGGTTNEAIISANEYGERKMREKEYDKAISYFHIAYYLCSDSREKEFKRKRDAAEYERGRERKEEEEVRERVRKQKEQEERERVRKQKEQEERERKEKEQKERERKEKEREERERKEKEQKERERKEKEQKERERKEKEQKERERKEKEQKERERKEKEQKERERKEKESRRERMQEQLQRMELKDSTNGKNSTETHLQANLASHYVISSRDIV